MGQHRNEIYSEVAKTVEFVQWVMAQPDPSAQNKDFLTWMVGQVPHHPRWRCAPSCVYRTLRGADVPGTKKKGLGRVHLIHFAVPVGTLAM